MNGLDDFSFLTEQDKRHYSYGLCVLGMAGVGATFGSMAGGQTLLGAAGGAVMGLMLCKSVEAPLKRQLFGGTVRMSERDFLSLARQTKRQYPQLSKTQVLDLLGEARLAARREPGRYQC